MIQPIFRNSADKIRHAEKRARDLTIKRQVRARRKARMARPLEAAPWPNTDRPSVPVIIETRRISWIRNIGLTVDPHHTPPRGLPATEAQRVAAVVQAQASMDRWFAANPSAWTD